MNTYFSRTHAPRIVFTIVMAILAFACIALPAQAATEAEQFAQMEQQLNKASELVAQLVALRKQGLVLGVSTDSIGMSPRRPGTLPIEALKAQLSAIESKQTVLLKQRTDIDAQIKVNETEIARLKAEIAKVSEPTKPTPRFNNISTNGFIMTVSAVFTTPRKEGVVAVTGPVFFGKIDWGDGTVIEKVYDLANQAQKTVERKHTYKTAGTFTITLSDLDGKTASEKVVVNPIVTKAPNAGLLFSFVSSEQALKVNSPSTNVDDAGVFTLKLDATAFGTDAYVPLTTARGTTNLGTGVSYNIKTGSGSAIATGLSTAALSSTADKNGSYYVIHEGETKMLTLTVTFDPVATGFYSAGLLNLNWNDTLGAPDMQALFTPVSDFDSNSLSITN